MHGWLITLSPPWSSCSLPLTIREAKVKGPQRYQNNQCSASTGQLIQHCQHWTQTRKHHNACNPYFVIKLLIDISKQNAWLQQIRVDLIDMQPKPQTCDQCFVHRTIPVSRSSSSSSRHLDPIIHTRPLNWFMASWGCPHNATTNCNTANITHYTGMWHMNQWKYNTCRNMFIHLHLIKAPEFGSP